MEIRMFFSVLYPEKCKEIGKFGEILFGGLRTDKKLRENDFKRSSKISEIFPRKCRNFLGGPRTKTKFVKWAASRKRLRTAALVHIIYLNGCNVYDKRSHCDVKSINALYILFIHVDRNSFCYVTAATICEDSLTNRV